MNKQLIVIGIVGAVIVSSGLAQDYQLAALRQLSGKDIGPRGACFVDRNGDGIRDGVVGSTVTLAEVNAYIGTPAFSNYWPTSPEYAEWMNATTPYPAPEALAPILDGDGATVGTARLLVDATTMEPIAVTNSASPQRTWSEQKADYLARKQRREKAVADVRAAGTAAAAANSVPALRAQVAELARIIEELTTK